MAPDLPPRAEPVRDRLADIEDLVERETAKPPTRRPIGWQEQERQARRAERAAARQAREQARQRYEGLTKAELSDQLAERGLPKSGNVEELIDRLVDADNG